MGRGERSSGSRDAGSSSGELPADAAANGSRETQSCVPLVVAPVLARMLGHPDIQRDKQVQKALAQLKLAFDNLDKLRPGVSREVVTQMFELVVNSKNPAVNSLMPPTVAALASLSLHDQQQQAAAIATPGLAPHHHRAAPPDGHPPPA